MNFPQIDGECWLVMISEKKFRTWEITGVILVSIFGVFLHFLYDFSGKSPIAALFGPVNESTWEHLKLLFVPFLLYSVVEYCAWGREESRIFIPAKVFGLFWGLFAIVVSFYTYVGIIGTNYLWADMLTYFIGVITAFRFSEKWMKHPREGKSWYIAALVLLAVFIVCFVLFTWKAPHIGLFLDPVTQTYGIV